MMKRRFAAAALAAVGILALSCGGNPPTTSTPPTTVAPTPPTATPGTGGGVGASSCLIGMGSEVTECSRGDTRLLDDIEVAIDLIVRQKPDIFDLTHDVVPARASTRSSTGTPTSTASSPTSRRRACARSAILEDGTYEKIQVKDSNDYSEEFDVIFSSGFIRRGNAGYRQTCTPSSFPLVRGADAPPIGSRCGRPYPPPITRFNCKLHLKGIEYYTLDSTPIVGPDCAYCASIGYTDGRCLCAVRNEGAPDRIACENWRVGTAKDTGRPGPTWTKEDGSYCTGPESGCANSPNSPYQLWAYKGGRYKVEAKDGASCTVIVER